MPNVQDLIRGEFGAPAIIEQDPDNDGDIGTTSELLLRRDPNRAGLFIINLGSNTVLLNPGGQPATATRGIRLDANGGSISMNWRDDFVLPTEEWHAIAITASSQIRVYAIRLT